MYRHLLIATDGSELAGKGLDAGLALAAALQARATVVTASEPWQDPLPGDPSGLALAFELREEQRRKRALDAERILADVRQRGAAAGVEVEAVHVPDRLPDEAILETTTACGADLVVMASHGHRGLRRLLLGSQTQSVVSRSQVPVLVVR
ncbi:universal stress protein [Luteimonas kalidii]|uniref:Universal stress protein n=1 Tax=Luteimonas kalidii TaxID=3042025 RepID=A0ABT6JRW7_9GAMM|nr:universal stress protein [Luteimonas kalidii]MDH5833217.1 universal stress protein [Luteimonas kalidii]